MKKYKISAWLGAGYELTPNIIFAEHEEEAVEKLCAGGFRVFDKISELDDDDIEEYENSDRWLYVDSTMQGGECGYLLVENMTIEELPIEMFRTISIDVYDNPLGDCTNNGISSDNTRLHLIVDDGCIELPETDETLVVYRCEKRAGDLHSWLEPYTPLGSRCIRWMNGGNIGWTSDSRFPFDYPLMIHDRWEGC